MLTAPRTVPPVWTDTEWAVAKGAVAHACPWCREQREPGAFVYARDRPGQVQAQRELRRKCQFCRAGGVRTTHGGALQPGVDYMAAAERVLYPTVPYIQMDARQRLHAYYVARIWWRADGRHLRLGDFDNDRDADRMQMIAARLDRAGVQFLPIPPFPSA